MTDQKNFSLDISKSKRGITVKFYRTSVYHYEAFTAIHFVDFEISRDKGNSLKATIGYLDLNRGSINFAP